MEFIADNIATAKETVSGNAQIPYVVAQAIEDALVVMDIPPIGLASYVRVKTAGHFGPYGGNASLELSFQPVVLAPPQPQVQALPVSPPPSQDPPA